MDVNLECLELINKIKNNINEDISFNEIESHFIIRALRIYNSIEKVHNEIMHELINSL